MVPNGWKLGVISDLADTVMGYAFKSADFTKAGIPLLRMGNLYQNTLSFDRNPIYLPESFKDDYERFLVKPNDLVMSMTGTMGKRDYGFTVKIPTDAPNSLLNQRVIKFVPKHESSSGFLLNLLRSEIILSRLYAVPGGTKQANLSAKQIQELPAPIPPLPEQRKIAKILSTWDKAISTTEHLIENSKQQKKALMQQLLTGKKRLLNDSGKPFEGEWEEVKLEGHISFLSGHAFKSSEFQKDAHYKLLRGINISQGYLRWGEDQTHYWPVDEKFNKYILEKNDIVISMDGSLVGRNYAIISTANLEPMLLVQRVARLRCKSTLHCQYLLQHIGSEHFKSYVDAVKTVTAIPHISAKDIKHFKIPLPSVEEQQRIAIVLTNSDREIELLERQLADLKQEKKALMQQLLTGKRRVNVDDKEVA